MKKYILFLLFLITIFSHKANAQSLDVLFFYSDTCPHCHEEALFLETLKEQYPQIYIQSYEVSKDKENLNFFKDTAQKLGYNATSVPFLVINNEAIIGYQSDATTGKEIVTLIENAVPEANTQNADVNSINIPFIKKNINIRNMSLPILTVLIGVLDGFNPCAMWVLLFLISMLLGMENRKKMWLLGSTFIITSGVIYFLFLGAWLNIFILLGYTTVLRTIIGFVAAGIGIHYLNEYRKKKTGCEVTKAEGRQKLFSRIREIINRNNIALALIGIILLAITVNFVELLCSAGLPAIYTQILASNDLTSWQYITYLILYVIFFMLDDIILFTIAMVTLEATGISSKYTHISHLVGGILMLLIGILMLFSPSTLMMN